MTLERMLSAEARDVKAVLLVCSKCGSIQGYDPAKWNGSITYGCPNCPGARQWPAEAARQHVESLLTALHDLAQVKELPFEIRLQFDFLTEK